MTEQTRKNVEADHDRFMGGLNRNWNMEAIALRIQIEEVNKGRPLTEEEKNKIAMSQLEKPVKERKAREEERKERGDKRERPLEEAKGAAAESSSGESSDWDDWKDPEYIEE